MKQAKIIFTIILFISNNLFAQSSLRKDIDLLNSALQPHYENDNNLKYVKEINFGENEIKLLAEFLFVTYKVVFSSQDMDACVFTPSCSVYAIESIKKKGIIVGMLEASDRLQRCHPGAAKGHYKFDKNTGRYYDPVK